jgi:hypothetical protein
MIWLAVRMAVDPSGPIGWVAGSASRKGNLRAISALCWAPRSWSGRPVPVRYWARSDRGRDLTDTAWASVLLVVYAVGAAIPMLAIAYGGQAVTPRPQRRCDLPQTAAGLRAIVIAFAVASFSIRHADRGVTGFYPSGQLASNPATPNGVS